MKNVDDEVFLRSSKEIWFLGILISFAQYSSVYVYTKI
jgi:hypothetical protein